MEKRYVKYYEYEPDPEDGYKNKRVLKGEARFHQFGVDYEQFETGVGNYSTAIIELPDGTVNNVAIESI